MATVAEAFFDLIATAQPPALDRGPRAGIRSPTELAAELDRFFADHRVPAARQPHLRSLALLYHDHLDPAHVICQDLDDRDGNLLHALMHRREGDYENAKYWFHRVGGHPLYADLPAAARRVGVALPEPWDADALVDACAASVKHGDRPGTTPRAGLVALQADEFRLLARRLLDH